ncbi:MAG: hypothetical protein JO224_12625 [Pelomonas sp.]|nr:hypothetical protein [Roseateles sp.]
METKQLEFINEVVGIEVKLAERARKQDERRGASSRALEQLAGKKDAIRETMQSLRVVDKYGKQHEQAFSEQGQEYALDTFGATKKGRGLSKEDIRRAGEAMRPIVEAVSALREARGSDGAPLYRLPEDLEEMTQQIIDDVFTPLVREGVLPENFVTDQYSEVQRLINAALGSYKEENRSLRDENEKSQAKANALYYGAGDGLDQAGARLKALAGVPKKAMDKLGLDDKKKRFLQIGVTGIRAGVASVSAGLTLESWQVDPGSGMPKIEHNFAMQLNPQDYGYTDSDPDEARAKLLEAKRAVKVHEVVTKLGLSSSDENRILSVLDIQDDSNFAASKDGITGYGEALESIISDLGIAGDKLDKLRTAADSVYHDGQNVAAALKCAREIDNTLATLLDTHLGAGVGAAVKGSYAGAVDAEEVADAAGQLKADDQTIIAEYAIAFKRVFTSGLGGADLGAVGDRIARAFVASANGKALQEAIKRDPATAFAPLVKLAGEVLGRELPGVDPTQKQAVDDGLLKVAFANLARQLDKAVVAALHKDVNPGAAEAFAGLYAAQLKPDAVLKGWRAKTDQDGNGDGAAVVAAYADAFVGAFTRAAPDSTNTAFVGAGKAIAAEFRGRAKGPAFAQQVGADMVGAVRALLVAGTAAVDAAVGAQVEALKSAMGTPEAQRAIAAKAVYPDGGDEALDELKASEEELADYERQLVLIDEGGMAAADLKSIEKLIAQIERDRAVCEMVLSVGSVLTSLGSTTTSIVGAVTVQVTDTLVGEIVGPLKAAKLIMKFAIAMKAANERRILLQKFKKSLKLSKKAVSPLQSTVQGFFDNKVEQVTFRSIEDALTLVQIAAAILGSVPEPITLAVGKSIGAAATAAELTAKTVELAYNEKMLSSGWDATLGAIRNPRDRALGLRALRLNPTLGMHAIAWAAMNRVPPDPIARNLLDELGLDEQTLAASGSAAKVRKYMLTLLDEDRELTDPDKIAPKWLPKPLEFDVEGWAVLVQRAAFVAEPKLVKSTEREVLVQLKLVMARDLGELAGRAKTGAVELAEIETVRAEIGTLRTLLRNYAPVTADGSTHEEMGSAAAIFIKKAADREAEIEEIVAANLRAQMYDAARVAKKLTARVGELDLALAAPDDEALEGVLREAFDRAATALREVQEAQLDDDGTVKPLYDSVLDKAGQVSVALEAFDV